MSMRGKRSGEKKEGSSVDAVDLRVSPRGARGLPEGLKEQLKKEFGCNPDSLVRIRGFPFAGELNDYMPEDEIKAKRYYGFEEGPFNLHGVGTIKGSDSKRTMVRVALKVAVWNGIDPVEYVERLGTVIYEVNFKRLLDVRDKRTLDSFNLSRRDVLDGNFFQKERRRRTQLVGMTAYRLRFEGVIYASSEGNHVVVFMDNIEKRPKSKTGPKLREVYDLEGGQKQIAGIRNQKTLMDVLIEEMGGLTKRR